MSLRGGLPLNSGSALCCYASPRLARPRWYAGRNTRGSFMLKPDGLRVMPEGWAPPACRYDVSAVFADGRADQQLWVAPFLLGDDGEVRMYVAAGPAGQPIKSVTKILVRPPLAAGMNLSVVRDKDGQMVFSQVLQTPN